MANDDASPTGAEGVIQSGYLQNCQHTLSEHEGRMEEIVSSAKAENREDVMDSFCTPVLQAYICRHHDNMSAQEMFLFLKGAVDCREELHQLERTMDKNHFVELVTAGYIVAGGVDKETNLAIFWFQSGRLDRNSWRYTVGTPRANAYVRCVFGQPTHIVVSAS